MLDIGYPSLAAFLRDCVACGYDADMLLADKGQNGYTVLPSGAVQANDYI